MLVGAFGWYVARRIARPVRDISIAAGRVAAGDLDVRVPEGGPGDLDRLSRAFNAMAASLAEAQDALRRRADELEASGRRTAALLEPVFEQAPAGLAVFDEQMRFVRVNAALARMDGVPQEEHLGRTIGEVLPGMAGELGARLRDVIAERRTITDAEVEGRTRARPGEVRVWRASYFPVLADEGPAMGSGAIFVDITDHRRAERERRRLLVAERLAAAHTARLQEITSRLSRAVGAGDVAQVVVDQGVAALRAQAGVVVLLERGASELRLAAQDGYDEREALDWRDLPLSDTAPLAEAVREGRVVAVVGRRELRERYPARAHVLERPGHRVVDRRPDPRRRRGARRRACSRSACRGGCPTTTCACSSCSSRRPGRRSTAPRCTSASATSPRRSNAACCPPTCPRSPGSTSPRSTARRGTATRSAGTSTTSCRRPAGASSSRSATCRARARRRRRSPGSCATRCAPRRCTTPIPRTCCGCSTASSTATTPTASARSRSRRSSPGRRHVRVRVACGGHLPPIVTRRDEAPAEVACRGTLLGVEEEIDVVCEDLELGLGDGLVLYTDGVLDAAAPTTTLTAAHLVALLAEAADASPHETAWRLHDAAVGGADKPRDDIAIVALRVTSGEPLVVAPPAGGTSLTAR